jgi:hypothetical protein
MSQVMNKLCMFVIGALSLVIISCGGGGGGGGSSTSDVATNIIDAEPSTGSVTLLATDAPTDEFKEINLSIVKVELLSDDGRVTVFEGEKEFDLLQLTEVTEVFSVSDVREGSYNKIRLILSQIELVFHDDRSPAYPRLPGNGKLDLNPRETFHVESDQPLAIQLDFDAKKSIHVVQTGNQEKYNFRPVVFVQIVEGEFDTKLIRQRGTINDLDIADGEFKLCLIEVKIQPISSDEDDLPDCVLVDTNTAPASIFDDFADPVDLEDLDVGDIVTVVGRFRLRTDSAVVNPLDSDNGNENENGNGNGNGNGNSNKKDMEEAEGEDHEGSSDEDSADDDAEHNQLVLIAEVVWSGNEIMQSDNIACSDVTNNVDLDSWYENFEQPLPENTGCAGVETRPTILQPGARIYDKEGKQLPTSSIFEGTENQVDGYLDTGASPDELKAVLVMLDMNDDEESSIQLSGTIGDITPLESLILITDDGDRCVNFSEGGTEVFETDQDGEENILFNQMGASALMSGQIANAFGKENVEGCLNADTIIYEEEEGGEEGEEDEVV